jgi:hypothetical protein
MHTLVTGDGGVSASETLTQLVGIIRNTSRVNDSLTGADRIQNLHPATKHRGYPKAGAV